MGNFLSDKRIMSVCTASLFAPVSGLVGGARGGIGSVPGKQTLLRSISRVWETNAIQLNKHKPANVTTPCKG